MTTTDHAQESVGALIKSREWLEDEEFARAELAASRAQAHATLAVAHELKTANLIAALSAGYLLGHDHEDEAWDVEIATRLGLDGGAGLEGS